MAIVTQRALQDAVLAFAEGMAGPLNAVRVALFINNVIPTIATLVGDLELCTEGGMEAQTALTPGPPFEDTDGTQVCVVPVFPFVAAADPDPVFVVYGWACLNAGGTALYAAEKFENPITIQRADQGVSPIVKIPWGL